MSQPKSQESKEAFEREKQMHLEHEAKFIDDLKRAILLDGGYVDRLDQEVNIWAVFVLWREGARERARAERGRQAGRQGGACCARLRHFMCNLDKIWHRQCIHFQQRIVCGMDHYILNIFVAHNSIPNHQYLTIQFTLLNPVQLRACSLFF